MALDNLNVISRLNVHKQSTIFKCVRAVNGVPSSIILPLSEFKSHVLRRYSGKCSGSYIFFKLYFSSFAMNRKFLM